MMTATPDVSIIVPAYNAEKGLRRCVDSIIAQTVTNWELLIVDDGSTDMTATICREYAASDSRIRFIRKTNGGAASARNVGLDYAHGQYVCFVDADDYIPSSALASYLAAPSADIVIAGAEFIYGTKRWVMTPPAPFCGSRDLFLKIVLDLTPHLLGSPCNKLYRREFIADTRFPTDVLDTNEDQLFNWELFIRSQTISVIPDLTYHYVQTAGSLSHSADRCRGEKYARRQLHSLNRLYGLFSRITEHELCQLCQRRYHSIAFHGTIRAIYISDADADTKKEILAAWQNMTAGCHYSFWKPMSGIIKKLRSASTRLPVPAAHAALTALYGVKRLLPKRK